jgi:hypothetical protein
MTVRIVGLDKAESDLVLNYLYDVYERKCRHTGSVQVDSSDERSMGQQVSWILPAAVLQPNLEQDYHPQYQLGL